MSMSPVAGAEYASADATDRRWQMAVVVVFIVAALTVLGVAIGLSLDDGPQVRRSGVTTQRTVVGPSVEATYLGDLGGAYHHRGGNQP